VNSIMARENVKEERCRGGYGKRGVGHVLKEENMRGVTFFRENVKGSRFLFENVWKPYVF